MSRVRDSEHCIVRSRRQIAGAALRVRALAMCAYITLVVVECGCRSGFYTTKTLPADMQTLAMPTSTELNLERMGSDGFGTSQLGPGDLVTLTIVSGNSDEKITPIPARIGPDGTMVVPMVGGVKVGDMEPADAEQRIAAAAVERGIYRQPSVTLTVLQRATNRVTVLGAVAKPGLVELQRGSSDLASAIAAAGGLDKNAGTVVEVLRRPNSSLAAKCNDSKMPDATGVVQQVSWNTPLTPAAPGDGEMTRIDLAQAGTTAMQNRQLQDRDVVNVLPQEKRVVHVTGLVRNPNQFELVHDKDIRVLDAIAMAGGTTTSFADKVYVIRQLPNMAEPAVIQVSIAKAKQHGDENLRLAAGDLVSVEETMSTMTVDTIGKFFRVALGLNGSVAAF